MESLLSSYKNTDTNNCTNTTTSAHTQTTVKMFTFTTTYVAKLCSEMLGKITFSCATHHALYDS